MYRNTPFLTFWCYPLAVWNISYEQKPKYFSPCSLWDQLGHQVQEDPKEIKMLWWIILVTILVKNLSILQSLQWFQMFLIHCFSFDLILKLHFFWCENKVIKKVCLHAVHRDLETLWDQANLGDPACQYRIKIRFNCWVGFHIHCFFWVYLYIAINSIGK